MWADRPIAVALAEISREDADLFIFKNILGETWMIVVFEDRDPIEELINV